MNIVPRINTPATRKQLAESLERAYTTRFGSRPSRQSAELLLSQILIETADGKSVQNNSPGNVTASSSWAGDAWRPTWFEVTETSSARDKMLHERMKKNQAPSAFRSFRTLDDGMSDYIRTLAAQFRSIIEAASSGVPRNMAEAVFTSRYCPDPECHPDRTTTSFDRFQKQIASEGLFLHLPLVAAPAAPPAPSHSPSSSLPAPWHSSSGPSTLPVLRLGARGSAVTLAQRLLGTHETGVFTDAFADVVRQHQRRAELDVDAVIGPRTWESLHSKPQA